MRRAVLALVLVVGLAACAESDPSTVGTAPTTTAAGQPGPASTAPPTRPTTEPGPAPSGPSGSLGRDVGGPGSIADLYLRPAGSSQLVVQVLTESGAVPSGGTVDRVVTVLGQVSGKPVTTVRGTVAGRATWSGADLRVAADGQRPAVPAGTALLRLLLVHGRSDEGDDVLGITPRGDIAAVFVDRVEAAAGLTGPAAIERAVAVHELGHVLGLVDLFLHTGRADPDHPGHSTNPQSVMYWAVESSLIGDLLSGGPPQDFDDADRADLAAIRRG